MPTAVPEETLRARAIAWCREGRSPWWRAPLLLYGAYVLYKILTNDFSRTPLGHILFGVHEMGHVLFRPGGEWLGIAGGSLTQILVPIFGVWQFVRQRDFFGAAFCLSWLAESFLDLSPYIGDARTMELPLANLFGGDPIHDWNYLLASVHRLPMDHTYALYARFFAFVCELAFLWIGSWLVWQMWVAPRE